MSKVTINITEGKPKAKYKRRIYRRRVATASAIKDTLCQLGLNGFLSVQQVEILVALLGVKNA